jgi:organic radical activating enzyme
MATEATEHAKTKPPCAEGRTNIMWLPTVRCQLKCPYCQWHFKGNSKEGGTLTMAGGATWKIGPERKSEEWLEWLKPYAPYHLEIAGGEPTLYKGLADFLRGMPEGCSWAITTNGLEVPCEEDLSFNCVGYAVSFHIPYAQQDEFYTRKVMNHFILQIARGYGANIKFSIVITPETIAAAEYFTKMMRLWGHVVHYNQAALVEGLDWDKHPDVVERMKKLAGETLIEYPWRWEDFPIYKQCTAGDKNYFFLMPDGNVLRCHSQIYWKDSKPIGHISTWKPTEGMQPCGKPHLWVCDDRATEKE